jgi:hypothetical protein
MPTLQDMRTSAAGDLHLCATIQALCVQAVGTSTKKLVAAIRSRFSVKRLAVIIDDVWDLNELANLGLALDCRSSVLVTSREALPGGWVGYKEFNFTGESNMAQQEAILASYVAADPEAATVPDHLKVHLPSMSSHHQHAVVCIRSVYDSSIDMVVVAMHARECRK